MEVHCTDKRCDAMELPRTEQQGMVALRNGMERRCYAEQNKGTASQGTARQRQSMGELSNARELHGREVRGCVMAWQSDDGQRKSLEKPRKASKRYEWKTYKNELKEGKT